MKLYPAILNGLVKVRALVLFNNRLHFKKGDAPFREMSSLTVLEMRYQGPAGMGLGYLDKGFFTGLSQLRSLAMGNTIDTEFHPDTFTPLVSLQKLYLAGLSMRQTNLTALLWPLRALKKLDLYQVDLDFVPAPLLPMGNSLEILHLKSNHLRGLQKALFESLPRLAYLDVRDNPLSCTCDNAWLKTWAVTNIDVQVCS